MKIDDLKFSTNFITPRVYLRVEKVVDRRIETSYLKRTLQILRLFGDSFF